MSKTRLDVLLVEKGLAKSRHMAQLLILEGKVKANGQPAFKPGQLVEPAAELQVEEDMPYVSRGGQKLEAALAAFALDAAGLTAADVGASTGGFTDCLLKHGAARVYAIDVGYGQIAWSLRNDSRVVLLERTNVRFLDELPEKVGLITIDVSFISLRKVLPVVMNWLAEGGSIIPLIKPQFEAGRGQVGKGGVIRDAKVHRQVLQDICSFAQGEGLALQGLILSPIKGPAGNIEFLAHFRLMNAVIASVDALEAIERLIPKPTEE